PFDLLGPFFTIRIIDQDYFNPVNLGVIMKTFKLLSLACCLLSTIAPVMASERDAIKGLREQTIEKYQLTLRELPTLDLCMGQYQAFLLAQRIYPSDQQKWEALLNNPHELSSRLHGEICENLLLKIQRKVQKNK